MNLRQTIDLYFGGDGSGCVPEVAEANGTQCGRPPKDRDDGFKTPDKNRPDYSSPEGKTARNNPQMTDAEKNDHNFQRIYSDLKSRSDLTQFEKDNMVVLARGYFESGVEKGESIKDFAGPVNGFTAERAAAHQDIFAHYEAKYKTPKERPVAIFTGGLPGAGKTVGLRQTVDMSKYVNISADDVKEMLPGYNGNNAPYLHEESAMLADALIMHAGQAKQDIIVDGTMKTYGDPEKGFGDSTAGRIKALADLGYDIHLQFTDVSIKKSIESALTRYMDSGRFLAPDAIRHSASKKSNSKNLDNFMGYRSFDGVKSWKIFSRETGELRLVDQGGSK